MTEPSSEERRRRWLAERGHWQEAEDLGRSRIDAFMDDEFYERLLEIRRGLITAEDKRRMEEAKKTFRIRLKEEVDAAERELWGVDG